MTIDPAQLNPDPVEELFWTDELLFGHPVVDAQHREITTLSEEILAFLGNDPGQEEAVVILTEYCKLLSNHFSFEEGLMSKLSMEKYERHIRPHALNHRAMITCVKNAVEEIAAGNRQVLGAFRGLFIRFLDNVRVDDAQLFAILEKERILRRRSPAR